MKFIKVILTDFAGVVLIIMSALLGWLPGPGGIPLFVAGLSLLAINHQWARDLLNYVKKNGLKFFELFFREHRLLMTFYDVLASILIVVGIFSFGHTTRRFVQALTVATVFIGLGLFLGNRKRTQRIVRFFKKTNK